jgi:pyruvate/oxaloacetate carboxyltransferase
MAGHVQAAFCYTLSPVHSLDSFVKMAQELKALGADSSCCKDMAALLTPYAAYELVKRLKAEVGLPVQVHTHDTSGFSVATLDKAARPAPTWWIRPFRRWPAVGAASHRGDVATYQGTDRDTAWI